MQPLPSTLILTLIAVLLVVCSFQSTTEAKRAPKTPIVLDEDSWIKLMQGEWMVDFYAPWCPACKQLEPEWKKFAEWSDDLNIDVASADVTENPGLSGRFGVTGLPTIYHVKDGVFRLYSGPREHKALIDFIEEQGWKSIQPVSRWWAPNTLQMSFIAYSFRISMALRDVHNYLVEDYGLPYYISYLIFALCTVTLGTLLGLLIVFVVDQFCPSRYVSAAHVGTDKKKSKDSDLDDAEVTESNKSNASERVRRRANK